MLAPETLKLPSFRVSCNHIFENEGVDYARPLYHKELFNNTVTMSKCYILLFTCAVTCAVHIELTPDMCAHSLILAPRRFISRKGTVKLIISDNFKSFKSALLKSYLRNHIVSCKSILETRPGQSCQPSCIRWETHAFQIYLLHVSASLICLTHAYLTYS